jgi:membrane protease YdiL (CAAX protease family)
LTLREDRTGASASNVRGLDHRHFFALTFLWTWGLWAVPIARNLPFDDPTTTFFFAVGGIAPSSVGILMAFAKGDRPYWRDFWKRIIGFGRIGWAWYAAILLLIPACSLLALLIDFVAAGRVPGFDTTRTFLADPVSIIPFAFFTLIFGPIPEEIGWRGFALDHLDRRLNWIRAGLLLGFFWGMWHLPLFLIRGTYQYRSFHESPYFAADYLLQFLALSIIMVWIYKNNRGSILSGVLLHFFVNFFGEFLDLPEAARY